MPSQDPFSPWHAAGDAHDNAAAPSAAQRAPGARVWPVGALCLAIGDALQARFGAVAVEGEISGLSRAASGHLYFALKDAQGQLRCAMFRRAAQLAAIEPAEGDRVIVQGRVSVYGPRGDLQLVVESMRRAGLGSLYEQFLQLKQRLQQEGLFDAARKRPPAALPRGLAIVTSPNAAALHDVLSALRRRAPHVPVLLVPALVQGAGAPASLRAALAQLYEGIAQGRLRRADGQPLHIDTILLVRGGGSIEDLWAFNDAELARLIVQSPVPLVAGIGHETDFTIADWCADLRAPTPTAAAELAALPRQQLLQALQHSHDRLTQALDRYGMEQQRRLQWAGHMLARPSALLAQHAAQLQRNAQRLRHSGQQQLERQMLRLQQHGAQWPRALQTSLQAQQQRLAQAALRLRMLDPQQVLERGYAILSTAQGEIVRKPAQLQPGQTITARLAQGSATLQVPPHTPHASSQPQPKPPPAPQQKLPF
ncbi:exodeoxyribonuclease VII large subunit [Vandammella animalimorsus]|uniref:Exodeoxyribonuclease 7 large subunit n=1 Tax=Vandammella animalimorsus TaxID=2029117 RepID=A0A2A2B1D3_9BURK|nr:exodeoxyribonuclease VII large subunit [Vandammella animalimorsus]PAT43888.1 exodeoxyribonuclease VII large subunit [Vandammella animalimorsus]